MTRPGDVDRMLPEGILTLDFYGVRVSVDSAHQAVLEWVRAHFQHFVTEADGARVDVRVRAIAHPARKDRIPADAVARATSAFSVVYRRGVEVFVDFHGRGLWTYDAHTQLGIAESEDRPVLREIVRNAIAFKVDEHLVRRGIQVFRWLGFACEDRAALLLAPSGTGKTTLALDLIAEEDVSLLSDDRVLVGAGRELLPYPVSLHLRGDAVAGHSARTFRRYTSLTHEPRAMLDISWFRERMADRSRPSVIGLCSRAAAEHPSIEPVSRAVREHRGHRRSGKAVRFPLGTRDSGAAPLSAGPRICTSPAIGRDPAGGDCRGGARQFPPVPDPPGE